jgi:tetratricopeptide (TPR) repeat protein
LNQEGYYVPLSLDIEKLADLALALRQLRRRHARQYGDTELTYRELAAKTGYSHSVIGDYFTGKTLPPTDRLDVLVVLLGATGEEQSALATARDQIEERRWQSPAAAPASSPPTPHQLPGANRLFAGRATELETLTRLADTVRPGSAPIIIAIDGTAGIGKTVLALHWAHQVADQFPDGQLYLDLRGFDPVGGPVRPAEAIRAFLDAFGVPVDRIPVTLDAQVGLYRSLLADRQVLVVLDNAHDAEHVRSMLPGGPACLTVVTSRNRLTSLVAQGAFPLTLDRPTTDDCRRLLACHLGTMRIAAEQQAVDNLIRLCARLPLALAITAARAAEHPDFSLRVLAAELHDAAHRLDAWVSTDAASNVRAAFSCSYRDLSTPAARMFRLLGIHPGPDIGLAAAASMAGLTRPQAQLALTELTNAHLLSEHVPRRFAFHDLLRAYAAEQAEAAETSDERRTAIHRVLDHYLHTGFIADRLIDPHREPIMLASACPGAAPEDPLDQAQALVWFEAERRVLQSATILAADNGFDFHAWQIPWTLADFFDRQGHWHDWAATHHIALAAAQRLQDPRAEARVRRSIGNACTRLGHYNDARTHMERVLDLYRQLGDRAGQAHSHLNLGWMFEQQARYDDALHQAEQALELYREVGHRTGESQALASVGWCHALLGNQQEALACSQQALLLDRELADHHGEATTLGSLGFIYHHFHDDANAIVYYEQALIMLEEAGDRYELAVTLERLGDIHQSVADTEAAQASWEKALTILKGMGHSHADQIRTKLRCLAGPPRREGNMADSDLAEGV